MVIKLKSSAGTQDTGLFLAGDPAVFALADKILDDGETVMVQPKIILVASGESAPLFFNTN